MTARKTVMGSRRRPRVLLPVGACDAHCHVFGPGDEFPYAKSRRYTPEDAPKEVLTALHARLGISRAVIVQASCHGTDNRAMLDAIATAPDRLRGVAMLDATVTFGQLDGLHAAGVRGVRFNFVKHLGGLPDPIDYEHVIERIAPLGWHVVLHLDAQDISRFSPTFRRLKIPFVIDHMGRVDAALGPEQPDLKALLALAQMPNCWIKVSGAERIAVPPFSAAVPIAQKIMTALPERTLWGTDFPHPNLKHPVDEADLVDLLAGYGDAAALHRVLVTNPARLYGFEEAAP